MFHSTKLQAHDLSSVLFANMNLAYVLFLANFVIIHALQRKLFDRNIIEPSSILTDEVQEIKETSVAMDKITCSTHCLREDCDAFYFKDKTCKIIKNANGMIKSSTSNTEALTIFTNKPPKEEIGSLYKFHILVYADLWTPFIYKSEPSNKYEKCGILCEVTDQADFFTLHSGTCHCGSFNHSGSTLELDFIEAKLHLKPGPVDKFLDNYWIEMSKMDQWIPWIYKIHERDEQNYGYRDCLFRGMIHKECHFVKYDYKSYKCFLGSFYYTGEPMTIDTSAMDEVVYFKKDYCPKDWTLIGKTCYKVSNQTLDFPKAKETCNKLDAKLVEPKSLVINEKVASLVNQQVGSTRYFIGLSDRLEESK